MNRHFSDCSASMPTAGTKYFLFAVLLGISVLAIADRAAAQTDAVEFNIPVQSVPAALNEFARQARVQLFFISDGFENVRANAVVGRFPRQEALELLLAGTGLQASLSEDSGIKVAPADNNTSSVIEPSDSLFLASAETADNVMAQVVDESRNVAASREGAAAASENETPRRLEEIIVTGSRIRGAQSASPIITISRQEIDQAGFETVEDIVENLPQNFDAGATSDATNTMNRVQAVGGNVRNFAGGTSVNLRGLGASSTLVLLNGHRLSPGGHEARFTNIASIPVTAIERVEVMTDGASAIYGSDAIGGVVNFILRKNYDGAETRLRYGADARGSTSNVQFGQSFGTSWEKGNVLFTYEYYDSEALAAADRKFTASNDLSPFGGTDRRQPGGNPANIVAGGQTFAIPAGQDGKSLTAADFDLNAPLNLYNNREFADQIPNVERQSGFLHVRQAVSAFELFGTVRYSREERSIREPSQGLIDFTVTQDSPFFVDPTGTGLTEVTVESYSMLEDFGAEIEPGEIESSGVTLGARFDLGDNWHGELAGNWAKEDATRWTSNIVDRNALAVAVNLIDPALAFNPFGDGSNTNPAILESFIDRSRAFSELSENELWSASFNVDGGLFEIPGGVVKVAAGVDFREELLFRFENDPVFDTPKQIRDVLAVYGEVFFPIVSDSNGRMGLQRLELSLAARYEDYSDFGGSTSPKLGLLWSPTENLSLRGTIGTSFRAPALRDLDVSDVPQNDTFYLPQLVVDLGLSDFPFLIRNGGNLDLQAEEATTWTAGFQWRPGRIQGLSLDATYFNVDFEDRISSPVVNAFAALVDPTLAALVTFNPTAEQIAAVVNNPRYNPNRVFGGPWPAENLISGVLPVGAILDARITNTAGSVVTGADLQLAYIFEADQGSFNIGLNGSYLFDFERKLVAADPFVEEVDTLGRPVDFRARGNIAWSRDGWTVTGYVNYTDGYTDQFSSPARAVDSWTTVDLTITYETGENSGFLSDTRLSLSTQNLFDEDPPFVDTVGGVGYDATNADPLGQFFSLQIMKEW